MPGLILGVGLDVHEDGEPVERGGDGLRGRAAGEVLRGNEALDGVRVLSGGAKEGLEAAAQRVRGRVLSGGAKEGLEAAAQRVRGRVLVVRDPVAGLGHVGGRDGEDVQEALRAPGREPLPETVERGGRVQAQDGVRHVELVLHPGQVVGQQVEGGEVAVVVRERAGQLVGLLLRGGGGVGLADGRVEPDELADPGGRGPVEPPARLGQVREPLQAPSAGRGRVGEGLGVREGLVPLVAGLLEQLGELPQDLEVLLPKQAWWVRLGGQAWRVRLSGQAERVRLGGSGWAVRLGGSGWAGAYRERDGVADEQGRGRCRDETGRDPPMVARGGGRVQPVQVSREGVAELDAGRVVAEPDMRRVVAELDMRRVVAKRGVQRGGLCE